MLEVGLYGNNGHQIQDIISGMEQVHICATAAFDRSLLPAGLNSGPCYYQTLDELLDDPDVDLVSLCSPRRETQARDAIRCLEAGRHVYAEKPCALTEKELDRIIDTAAKTGLQFHEMADTTFYQPYFGMRKCIQRGILGTVIQVFAQKSYPYLDSRPRDEGVDGGLTLQAGVHAIRFVEHTACVRIREIEGIETGLGNPYSGGDLKMASSLILGLENGGVGAVVINYLNPRGFGRWGNEHLRIFGEKGFIEAVDGGVRTRIVIGEQDFGPVDTSEPEQSYFDYYVRSVLYAQPMPFSLEEELHPLRMIIRAKSKMKQKG
jgi:predicted dehydrogenase